MPLAHWQNFYMIVGPSAGALIGLQFVVLSLMASRPVGRPAPIAGATYATPTIVHFAAVLALSAIVCAPWDGTAAAAIAWGVLGVIGVIYSLVTTKRMRSGTAYRPELEDWLCHAVLPLMSYLALAGSAGAAFFNAAWALFAVAAAALVLLFCGIHNAWDAVTYHVFVKAAADTTPKEGS